MTNADRIRAMSDEELAAYLLCPRDFDPNMYCRNLTCRECVVEWLRQPAEVTT